MFRKLAITAIAVGAGLFILNSTHLGSYARTAWHKVRTTAKGQVPLEFQLETIRTEAAQLIPDMKKNLSMIAAETVAVQNLKDEIVVVQAELDKKSESIRTMRDDLSRGDAKVVYNGHIYSNKKLTDLLERNLGSAKRCRDEVEAKKALLEAKERSLEAAREQLASMKSQKDQMEVEIERIETELRTLRLAQTKSNFHLDDSRLSRIKESLADVRNQMKVQQTEADLLAQWNDDTIVGQSKAKTAAEVSKEADDFLGGSNRDEGTVTAANPANPAKPK
jgi:chromosome segregation ATPase